MNVRGLGDDLEAYGRLPPNSDFSPSFDRVDKGTEQGLMYNLELERDLTRA